MRDSWNYKARSTGPYDLDHVTGTGSSTKGKNNISQSLKLTTMEHLTDFELIIVGASVVIFCLGFNAFIKNVYLKNFKTTNKTS